jgi:hypothetical protein
MTGFRGQAQIYHTPMNRQWVWCDDCQKRGYTTRKGAKLSVKQLVRAGDKASKLGVYVCPSNDSFYHVGHRR